MLFHTHILLGIVLFLLIEPFLVGNYVVFFLLVLLGAVLPDIDSANSKINRWSGIIGIVIAFFFKHRGLFHSLFLHVVLFFIVGSVFSFYYATALFIGYVAHMIGDGVTLRGVELFYPFSKFKIRGPVRVGGFFEGVVFIGLVVVIVMKVFG